MDATDISRQSPRDNPSRSLSNQILTVIAEVDDRSVNAIEPLYKTIDPDALDALFAPQIDGSSRASGNVSFKYAGYWVTVSSEGAVEIDPTNGRCTKD
ncbi:HalOD1 output domain-containing protein [Haladaptatus caseinilyticus]|uniref:HalOD1 output domain-containing protein n=1 Tax=Haladaptatus caseinilyticus TaxID=2993314 RepID=UPI00224B20DF|nr:HalOD1 output domain-containing protein [Haladaptatus caseinilyticus]